MKKFVLVFLTFMLNVFFASCEKSEIEEEVGIEQTASDKDEEPDK